MSAPDLALSQDPQLPEAPAGFARGRAAKAQTKRSKLVEQITQTEVLPGGDELEVLQEREVQETVRKVGVVRRGARRGGPQAAAAGQEEEEEHDEGGEEQQPQESRRARRRGLRRTASAAHREAEQELDRAMQADLSEPLAGPGATTRRAVRQVVVTDGPREGQEEEAPASSAQAAGRPVLAQEPVPSQSTRSGRRGRGQRPTASVQQQEPEPREPSLHEDALRAAMEELGPGRAGEGEEELYGTALSELQPTPDDLLPLGAEGGPEQQHEAEPPAPPNARTPSRKRQQPAAATQGARQGIRRRGLFEAAEAGEGEEEQGREGPVTAERVGGQPGEAGAAGPAAVLRQTVRAATEALKGVLGVGRGQEEGEGEEEEPPAPTTARVAAVRRRSGRLAPAAEAPPAPPAQRAQRAQPTPAAPLAREEEHEHEREREEEEEEEAPPARQQGQQRGTKAPAKAPAKGVSKGVSKASRLKGGKGRGRKHGGGGTGESYRRYLFQVLRQVHPNLGISRKAMDVLQSFMEDQFERLAQEAGHLVRLNNHKTLTAREVQTAVRLALPGELAKHAVGEGSKAVMRFSGFSD